MWPNALWPVGNGGPPQALSRMATIGVVVAALSVLLGCMGDISHLTTAVSASIKGDAFSLFGGRGSPWQPAITPGSTRGLVQEEMVFGAAAPDPEELELLARMPRGPHALMNMLIAALFENSRRLWSIGDAHGSTPLTLEHGNVSLPSLPPIDELRILVEQSLLLVELSLKLFGMLLIGLVPLHLLAYWLLTQPFGLPFQLSFVTQILGQALAPFDILLSPLLEFAARVLSWFGMAQGDILDEDWRSPEVAKSAKRVLLGLLLLNIILSLMTLAALVLLVLTIRFSGLFEQ